MDSVRQHSVFRYFDLADSFVEIKIVDAKSLTLSGKPGLDKAGYRRLVIETCMPEFRENVSQSVETLFPDDPLMVEDILYLLCVEVNPGLSIHEVRLNPGPSQESNSGLSTRENELECSGLAQKAQGLAKRLQRIVIGQEAATESATQAIARSAAGLGEGTRPLASLLFTGRTGTGKTELARALDKELMGSNNLVRIDCSEFALAHEYSKLIGAPPGFVGHEDGGQLTDALRENPARVVLFDEVEKAHPKLHNLLLQILEEGSLTDGKGRSVSFEKAIVILTSNVGAAETQRRSKALGFGRNEHLEEAALREITTEALENTFSPEFLGRLDETILFSDLNPQTMERIARQKLAQLRDRAALRGMQVSFTPAVARWAAEQAYQPAYGARELRRVLRHKIEPFLVEELTRKGGPNEIRLGVRAGQVRRLAS